MKLPVALNGASKSTRDLDACGRSCVQLGKHLEFKDGECLRHCCPDEDEEPKGNPVATKKKKFEHPWELSRSESVRRYLFFKRTLILMVPDSENLSF